MSLVSKPKRKNDDPPRFPAWVVVVVAITLVVVAFLLFRPAGGDTSTVESLPPCIESPAPSVTQTVPTGLDPLELTATAIVQMATDTTPCEPVGGTLQSGVTTSSDLDPAFLTATYIIQQATQGAANSDSDPFIMTASAIVEMATSQALGTPPPNVTTSSGDLDPFVLTATAIVQQVTDTAATATCAVRMGCGG